MTTVYLLRHAESAPDTTTPEPDWPLSEKGLTQAKELVGHLEPLGVTQIISSPYRRAIETAQPFADMVGQPIHVVEDFRERKLCNPRWLGDNFLETMQSLWSDLDLALEGGESGTDCQRRIKNVLQTCTSKAPTETILVSSHGQAISLFLRSLDDSVGFQFWKNMLNPDLFRLELTPSGNENFHWDKEFRPLGEPSTILMRLEGDIGNSACSRRCSSCRATFWSNHNT